VSERDDAAKSGEWMNNDWNAGGETNYQRPGGRWQRLMNFILQ
jgi:hypothetical protein